MTSQEQIQRISDIAQEKGWSVNVEDKNESRVLLEFQRYTINFPYTNAPEVQYDWEMNKLTIDDENWELVC